MKVLALPDSHWSTLLALLGAVLIGVAAHALTPWLGLMTVVLPAAYAAASAFVVPRGTVPVTVMSFALCIWTAWPRAEDASTTQAVVALFAWVFVAVPLVLLSMYARSTGDQLRVTEDAVQTTERVAKCALALTRLLEHARLTPVEAARLALVTVHPSVQFEWAGLISADKGGTQVLELYRDERISNASAQAASAMRAHDAGVLWRDHSGDTPAYVNDILASGGSPVMVTAGVRGCAFIPVLNPGAERLTLVALRFFEPRAWRDTDRHLLETAGRNVRIAVERALHTQTLEYAADHDPLTGLLNRRAFTRALAREAELTGPTGFGLVMIDLDGLKQVNDKQGHARGDDLLTAFAHAAERVFYTRDTVFRLGGDEFALILRQAQPGGADIIYEKMRRLEESLHASGFPEVGASIGWAHFPTDAAALKDLQRIADERMYITKRERRACRSVLNVT